MVKFIGATTENPSFEVNNAILSRVLVFAFNSVEVEPLKQIMLNALSNTEILGDRTVEPELLELVAKAVHGDVRKAITLIESVVNAVPEDVDSISTDLVKEHLKAIGIRYDKAGDSHYDTVSALIKSIRASHVDAAVYYLAKMLEGGDDPMFVARRLVIAASEDIGNANPKALLLATAGMQAVHQIGMPEARIVLSQVTTYLASSPKSNRAYEAVDAALADVKKWGDLEIPMHLRNPVTDLMKEMGYGKDYAYPHSHPDEAKARAYLPEELRGKQYYQPAASGVERQIAENLAKLRPTQD